jgi:hypothetical protein
MLEIILDVILGYRLAGLICGMEKVRNGTRYVFFHIRGVERNAAGPD